MFAGWQVGNRETRERELKAEVGPSECDVDKWDHGASRDHEIWRLSTAAVASERLRESDTGWGDVAEKEWMSYEMQGLDDWGKEMGSRSGGTRGSTGELEQLTRAAVATESLRSMGTDDTTYAYGGTHVIGSSSKGGGGSTGRNGGWGQSWREEVESWDAGSPLSGMREREEEAWGYGEEDGSSENMDMMDADRYGGRVEAAHNACRFGSDGDADVTNPPADSKGNEKSITRGDGGHGVGAGLDYDWVDGGSRLSLASDRQRCGDESELGLPEGQRERGGPAVIAVLAENSRLFVYIFVRFCGVECE